MAHKLYVENIIEDLYDATIGIERNPDRIKKNLRTVMNIDEKGVELLYSSLPLIMGDGFSTVTNFKQFIVRIQLNTDQSKTAVIFYDFKNNVNSALECYIDGEKNGWDKFSKDSIMKEFLTIQENYDSIEFAELTTGSL